VPDKVTVVKFVVLSDFVPESESGVKTGSDTAGNAYRTITMPEPPAPPVAEKAVVPEVALLQ